MMNQRIPQPFNPWAMMGEQVDNPYDLYAMNQPAEENPATTSSMFDFAADMMNNPLPPLPVGNQPASNSKNVSVLQKTSTPMGGGKSLFGNEDFTNEMTQAYQDSLKNQKSRMMGYEDELKKLGERPKGLMAMDLSPAAALVDSWTGSNLRSGYNGPVAANKWDSQKAALQNAIDKSQAALTADQLNYLKLKADEQKNNEAMQLRKMMMGAKSSKGDLSTANRLRDAWDKHDISKSYRGMESAMSRIDSSDTNDAAGDMSMIFAFMKMLDENSTVRESEYAQAERARGLDQTLQSWYIKASTGEKLLPEQREQFKNVARNIFKDVQKRKAMHDEDFRYLAEQSGVDPNMVVYTSRPGRDGAGAGSSMSADDQAALQWANSNPQDPRAIQIKQKLGVK